MHSATQIQLIADTLLPGFLPKDQEQKELTFHFTIPPGNHYKVWYHKTIKKAWEFVRFEKVEL